MADYVIQARNIAGNKFRSGLNCAESILQTFNELLNLSLDPNMTIL